MSIQVFRGDALAVAQVSTIVCGGTPTAGQTFTTVINRKSVVYTALSTDTTLTILAASIAAALTTAGTTIAEFGEITWTSSVANVIATGPATGATFTISSTSASGSGSPTFTNSITTASAGLYHVDDPTNWTQNRLPAGQCATPVQAATALVAGGSMTATTHYFVITATNANGETVKSNEQSATTSGGNISVAVTWAAIVGATGYKVYRSTSSGTYGASSLAATISNGTTVTTTITTNTLTSGQPPGSSTALGDDVYFIGNSTGALYGLTTFANFVFNSLHIDDTYTGQIGLPDVNSLGYAEYRQAYFQCSPLTVYVGENNGSGSSLVRIDKGSANAVAWIIYQTGTPLANGSGALQIIGANASDTMVITTGIVSCGVGAGNTFQLTTLETGFLTSVSTDVVMYFGPTAVLGTITMNGGTLYCPCNVTTLTQSLGLFYLQESGAITTFTGYGGTFYDVSNGTITSVTVDSGCTFDKSSDGRAQTITNCTMRNGSTFLDPNKAITFTNPFFVDGTQDTRAPAYATIVLGNGYHLQRS